MTLIGHPGLRLSEQIAGAGDVIFRHARAHNLKGIVSKRVTSLYRSGRTRNWVKTKCAEYQRSLVNEQ